MVQPANRLHIIHVASEVYPHSHSGGLGLVTGALPAAQSALGLQTSVITPLYDSVRKSELQDTACTFRVRLGTRITTIRVFQTIEKDVPIYFLHCPEAFARTEMYGPRPTLDYADNAWRFALLCRGALELCRRLRLHPDIFHCHDWHAGLLPFWCRTQLHGWVRTIQTIHNLGYQGTFPADTVEELGIDPHYFQPSGLEFWGWLSFLKAGLVYADRITTVSPSYATEILEPRYGNGLDGVLRCRQNDIVGILNGIDTTTWDPSTATPPITPDSPVGKSSANQRLRSHFELEPGGVLLCIVSRLIAQKGIDLIPSAIRPFIERGEIRLIAVGDGDCTEGLHTLTREFPNRVALDRNYRYALARDVVSGSDGLLMPSRYEPCGLTQLIAMRYGTLPIVRHTGGLADSVVDGKTGFTFEKPTVSALREVIRRFIEAKDQWKSMSFQAMNTDYSWTNSAQKYIQLYEEVHAGE